MGCAVFRVLFHSSQTACTIPQFLLLNFPTRCVWKSNSLQYQIRMPPSTTRVNIWDFYHRTDELFLKLAEILMANRGDCVLHSGRLGRHRGTVPLQMVSIRTQRFPRLLLKSRRREGRKRDDRVVKVMIVANEHGRELITPKSHSSCPIDSANTLTIFKEMTK